MKNKRAFIKYMEFLNKRLDNENDMDKSLYLYTVQSNTITMDNDKKQRLIDLVRTGKLTDRIVVLEGVSLIPFLHQDYLSPYFYIGMCLSGESHGYYNYKRCDFYAGEICWILPDHVLSHSSVSPDYKVLSVFIPKMYLEKLKDSGVLGQYLYFMHTHMLKLTVQQFDTIYSGFKFLQYLTDCAHSNTDELIISLIHIIAALGNEFVQKTYPGILRRTLLHEQLFVRFYDAVIKHYRESREVTFYANQLCLTPKYFATVIKKTTGIAASEWISRHVIIRAKYLLSYEHSKSIMQIANELGFSELSAFTRYFRTHTGITPKKFREL